MLNLDLALEADRSDKSAQARQLYGRLMEEFPESRLIPLAHFNLGLLDEEEEAWLPAAEHYRVVALRDVPTHARGRRTWVHAHFRLAVCAGKANDWRRAAEFYGAVSDALTAGARAPD